MNVGVINRTEPSGGGLATSTPWAVVLDVYLDTLDSASTRRAYRWHIADAMTAMGAATLADLTAADLLAYRVMVTGSTSHSPSTQAQALSALRGFLSWSRSMGAHAIPAELLTGKHSALKTPRTSVQRPYSVLTEAEIGAIRAAAVTPRDKALLAVMIGGGLRVSEATGLDVGDVIEDADGGTVLHIRQGKGRKDRMVPVHGEVAGAIRAYLAATGRRLTDSGPLFTAADRAAKRLPRGRLTPRAVGLMVARCAQLAGITAKSISPHSLRHSFAIRTLRAGGNVVGVSKLLGHASTATTARYVDHLALGELRDLIPHLPGEAA